MKEKDIILSVCGCGDYGEPRGCVTVNFAKWHMEEQREEVIKGFFTNEPVINITRTLRLTMVDLIFEMGEGSDFDELLDVLCMSSEPGNSFDGEEDVMPVLYMTIMPYEYEMEYFMTGMHGVWCLMPSVPEGEIDMVRLIFNNELFSVYQVDQEVLGALSWAAAYQAGEDFGDKEDSEDEESFPGERDSGDEESFPGERDSGDEESFSGEGDSGDGENFEDGKDSDQRDYKGKSYGFYDDFGESRMEENLEEDLKADGQGVLGDETGNRAEDLPGGGFESITGFGELLEEMDEDIWRN